MNSLIKLDNKNLIIDLNQPIDISIPITNNQENLTAWYVDTPSIKPVTSEGFIGSIKQGGSVNFSEISFNPHGHGTHTESVGHIEPNIYPITKALKKFHFYAYLITVSPKKWTKNEETRQVDDQIITLDQIKPAIEKYNPEAVVIRTIPNKKEKTKRQYSNTNPPYLCHKVADFLAKNNVKHLLIDLPSVDKEFDRGELKAHKAFWQYPKSIRFDSTITELVYVSNEIEDGEYVLNLQVASFENDASPSKPVLYKILTNEH